jgi:hypothetical protein
LETLPATVAVSATFAVSAALAVSALPALLTLRSAALCAIRWFAT